VPASRRSKVTSPRRELLLVLEQPRAGPSTPAPPKSRSCGLQGGAAEGPFDQPRAAFASAANGYTRFRPLELEAGRPSSCVRGAREGRRSRTFELDGNTPAVRELWCAASTALPLAPRARCRRGSRHSRLEAMLERPGRPSAAVVGVGRGNVAPNASARSAPRSNGSYELLSNEERSLFARPLGPSPEGSRSRPPKRSAMRRLDATDVRLFAKSLGAAHGPGRYSMLETIRAYALERLGRCTGGGRRAATPFLLPGGLPNKAGPRGSRREGLLGAPRLEPELEQPAGRARLADRARTPSESSARRVTSASCGRDSRTSVKGRSRLEAALRTLEPKTREARALALVWGRAVCAAWLGDTETGDRAHEGVACAVALPLGDRDEGGNDAQHAPLRHSSWRGDNAAGPGSRRRSRSPLTRTIGHETWRRQLASRCSPRSSSPRATSSRPSRLPAKQLGGLPRALVSVRIRALPPTTTSATVPLIGRRRRGRLAALPAAASRRPVEIGDRVEVFTELQGVAMSLGRDWPALTSRASSRRGPAEEGFDSLGVRPFRDRVLDGAARALPRARPGHSLARTNWNAGRQLDEDQAVALAMAPAIARAAVTVPLL